MSSGGKKRCSPLYTSPAGNMFRPEAVVDSVIFFKNFPFYFTDIACLTYASSCVHLFFFVVDVKETSGADRSLDSDMWWSRLPSASLTARSRSQKAAKIPQTVKVESDCQYSFEAAYFAASRTKRNITQTKGSWAKPIRFTTACEWSTLTPSCPIPVTSPANNKLYSTKTRAGRKLNLVMKECLIQSARSSAHQMRAHVRR